MTNSHPPEAAQAAAASEAACSAISRSLSNASDSKNNASSGDGNAYGRPSVNETLLAELVALYLPPNYDFEVLKTARRLAAESARRVALQLPEGLLAWGYQIAAILHRTVLSVKEVFVLGDVSYGACCIDDLKAEALGCDFLVHFGHSCLVPTHHTQGDVAATAAAAAAAATDGSREGSSPTSGGRMGMRVHYVFVDVLIDPSDLAEQLQQLLPPSEKLALQGTIQFAKTLHAVKKQLEASKHFLQPPFLPQVLPLTAGEVLGCTAPKLKRAPATAAAADSATAAATADAAAASGCRGGCGASDRSIEALATTGCCGASSGLVSGPESPEVTTVVFLADGRFHLEASLIQNPGLRFLRYDPFTKRLFEETYDHARMHELRRSAIERARGAKTVGLLFSTLGRQGSVGLAEDLLRLLEAKGLLVVPILMSEFSPHKLEALFPSLDAFVQIGCPRLSIDWGAGFPKPLLSPYEAHVAFGTQPYLEIYPMDFYAREGGPWTNYNTSGGERRGTLAVKKPLESRKAELRARLLEKQQQRRQLAQAKG